VIQIAIHQLQHSGRRNIVICHTLHKFRCWFPAHIKWKRSDRSFSIYLRARDTLCYGRMPENFSSSMYTFSISQKLIAHRLKNLHFQVFVQQQRQIYLITTKIYICLTYFKQLQINKLASDASCLPGHWCRSFMIPLCQYVIVCTVYSFIISECRFVSSTNPANPPQHRRI